MSSLDDRVHQIVAHAYENTTHMPQRMANASITPADIQTVDDLAKLPVLKKDDLIRLQAENPPFGGMLTVEVTDLKWVFFSPGPLYEGVMDDEESTIEMAAFLSDLGFTDQDVFVNAMSYHLIPFGIRFDAAARKLGGTVLPTGTSNSELQAKMAVDLGATAYIGAPSFLATLIWKIEGFGLDFRQASKLRKAIVTAEPLPPSLRERLEGYGLTLYNLYGTAEMGLLGYECGTEEGFHIPDTVIIQICDPQTGELLPHGEIGEIVATNFDRAYPLIRFGTGDLSIINPEPCSCGRPSVRMMGWMGRSGEAVKVRGMFVHPNQLGMIISRINSLGRYQVEITRPENRDHLLLLVELTDDKADQEALTTRIKNEFKEVCRVTLDEVQFVAPGTIAEEAKIILEHRTWE